MDTDLLLGAQATGSQISVLIDGVTYRVVQVDSQGRLVVTGAGVPTPIMLATISDPFLSGSLSSHGGSGLVSAAWPLAANVALYFPFTLTQSVTVVKLWTVNGNAVAGNVDIGIYDEAATRLVSIGSTAQAGVLIIQEFNIADTAMGPGRFYLALAVSNAAATFVRALMNGTTANVIGVNILKGLGVAKQAAAFPLPASATLAALDSATATENYIPLIGLSLRTLVA